MTRNIWKQQQLRRKTATKWTVCPSKSSGEALSPNVTIFEDRAFQEIIKVKWYENGSLTPQDWCPYKKRKRNQEPTHSAKVSWGHSDKVRSGSQGERPQAPGSRTPSFQSCGKVNYAVHGSLSRWIQRPTPTTLAPAQGTYSHCCVIERQRNRRGKGLNEGGCLPRRGPSQWKRITT